MYCKGAKDNHSLRPIRNVLVRRSLSIPKMFSGDSPLQVKINGRRDAHRTELVNFNEDMGPRVLEARWRYLTARKPGDNNYYTFAKTSGPAKGS